MKKIHSSLKKMNEVWVLTTSLRINPELEKILGVFSDYKSASTEADAFLRRESFPEETWKNSATTSDLVRFESSEGTLVSIKRFPVNALSNQQVYAQASTSQPRGAYMGTSSMFPSMGASSSSSAFPSMGASSSSLGVQTPYGMNFQSGASPLTMPHLEF